MQVPNTAACDNARMFTGIITGLGKIVDVQALGASDSYGRRLTLETPAGYLEDVQLGDSIALNGACMTVTSLDLPARRFTIDISAESLDKTAELGSTSAVNLEKAIRPHDRLQSRRKRNSRFEGSSRPDHI